MTIEINAGGWAWEGTETVLRRRGHVIASRGDPLQTVYPEPQVGMAKHEFFEEHGGPAYDKLFRDGAFRPHVAYFGRQGLRKAFRRLMAAQGRRIAVDEFTAICGRRAPQYIEFYDALQVIELEDDWIRLNVDAPNIGPSLEQYIAMLCMSEFRGHAEWGVSLEGTSHGDFDVIAWLPPTILYVECKGGSPADIDVSSLGKFLNRTKELSPNLSVLLVDSQQSIRPVCAKLQSAYPGVRLWEQTAPFNGIFYGVWEHWPIYAMNDAPSLLTQLRRCLRHFHSHGQWMHIPWGSIQGYSD